MRKNANVSDGGRMGLTNTLDIIRLVFDPDPPHSPFSPGAPTYTECDASSRPVVSGKGPYRG